MQLASVASTIQVQQSGSHCVQVLPSKGELRRALDDEIEALLTSLARVRHRRNALAPVHTLPSEILLKIFGQLSVDWAPRKGNGSRGEPSFVLGWIRVTHVCRHWREVALFAPTLWSDVKVESYSYPWIEEVVRRSGTAPLSLAISSYVPQALSRTSSYPDIAFIKPHLPRIRSISMSGHDLTTALSYILSMPALESLTLKQENLYFLEVPVDMLPSSYAPHLKQVTLINCKFQALPAAFSNLTSLSIAFDVFDCTHLPPDFDKHLVAILEGMPYLEDLSLRDAFPPSLSDRRILRFPSTLKTISLEAAYRFVPGCIYLANASIPCGSLRTSLTLLSYPDHQPDIEGLVACILGPENPPSAISLTFHSPYNIVLRGWRNTWTSTPSFLSCSAPPADFSIADNRTQTYSCIKDVSYGACLEDVRELFMQDQNCGMHVPLEQWIPAFSHARKVHTLVIRGRPASLLETLVQTSDGESGKEPLLFPKLEILVLSFRDSDLWDVLVTPGELFERLEECLKVRRECGCPVRELHLPKGWRDIQSVRRIEQERVVDNLGFLNEGYA